MGRRETQRSPRQRASSLYRGDAVDSVAAPDPGASTSIVAHILYLGGPGRPTPFTSTTEARTVATQFAGADGRVWTTTAPQAELHGAEHVSHERLLADLRGKGKGRCRAASAMQVAQARAYVERWQEHLLDWSRVTGAEIEARVAGTFS